VPRTKTIPPPIGMKPLSDRIVKLIAKKGTTTQGVIHSKLVPYNATWPKWLQLKPLRRRRRRLEKVNKSNVKDLVHRAEARTESVTYNERVGS